MYYQLHLVKPLNSANKLSIDLAIFVHHMCPGSGYLYFEKEDAPLAPRNAPVRQSLQGYAPKGISAC